MSLLTPILLTLLAGLLTRLALPGFSVTHLTWIALVPFFLAQQGATERQRACLGLLYGVTIWAGSIAWLPQALWNWVQVPPVIGIGGTVILSLWHALPYLLFGLRGRLFPDDERCAGLLRDAALLTVLLSVLPMLFPGHVALGLYQSPRFIQTADLGGMPLVLFSVLLVNRCGADLLRRLSSGVNLRPPALLLATVLAGVALYGTFRLGQFQRGEGATLTVVAVQPAIPTSLEGTRQQESIASAAALTEAVLRGGSPVELVVWPEIPRNIDCDGPEPARLGLIAHARAVQAPLLFNCVDFGAGTEGEEKGTVRNTVLMLDGQGRPAVRYHKQILFPFGEYIPFEREAPWLRRLAPSVSVYRPGTEAKVFDLGRGRGVIPLLCYEAMFGGPIRQGIAKGGNVLINMTDDAWFGRSDASEFHLAFLPFRAVEFRTPLVRANNAGISAVIAATGEILPGTKTGLFQRTALRRELAIPGERTLYCRFGDVFLYGLIAVCGIDLVRRRYVVKGTISCS